MTNAFLVKFSTRIFIDGQIQVNATSQEEAEEIAQELLQMTLNKEDCIIELENRATIKAMEVSGAFSDIDITDSIQLN